MIRNRIFISTVSLSALLLNACSASDGAMGEPGAAGIDGDRGEAGEAGETGLSGESGESGAEGEKGSNGRPGASGKAGAKGDPGSPGTSTPVKKRLVRLATTPLGAEVTGLDVTDNGEMFFNVQHPSSSLPGDEAKAAVGAWVGVDVNELDSSMESLPVPVATSAEAQSVQVVSGSYQVLGRAGDTLGASLPHGFGNITTADGVSSVLQSHNPDFNAFIPTAVDGSTGYLFTAWEDRPGGVTRLDLSRETDGSWTVGTAMNVDFSAVGGTIINCFGTVSPWGTPFTSEENYEAENTVRWNDSTYADGYPNYADVKNLQTYLGGTYPNPYDYGYIVEITNPEAVSPVPVKHFTLGRVAHENPVVMPDQKTVYLTDDGSNKAFFKFVADTAGDLSAGSLYAAKVTQDATKDSSRAGFNISWIFLAHGTNAEIEGWIDDYDDIDETDFASGSTSYITDAQVETWASGGAADDRVAFLESLKAAKAKGATVEFNKMEGININYAGAASGAVPFMYVGMAEVLKSMSDSVGDIQVSANDCGIVYRLGLTANYDVIRMDPVLSGGPYDATSTTDRCSVDGIAQPDNILVLRDGRVLIGEDTSRHANNAVWLFDPSVK